MKKTRELNGAKAPAILFPDPRPEGRGNRLNYMEKVVWLYFYYVLPKSKYECLFA